MIAFSRTGTYTRNDLETSPTIETKYYTTIIINVIKDMVQYYHRGQYYRVEYIPNSHSTTEVADSNDCWCGSPSQSISSPSTSISSPVKEKKYKTKNEYPIFRKIIPNMGYIYQETKFYRKMLRCNRKGIGLRIKE